ncbi:MAG TPA: NAD(P)/FAD-dependent oxidoreductase [Steroidobacteraceae bacterium]|nr:NAD(P)/FAD-dependent oxidoreductase [Steroidobacteraceae bacterium]
MESIDTVVIGAGVVGLAVARAMAQRGHDTLILEAAERFGSETSSRNSEVIHAGIYYPRGSLKARMCVQGRDLLYEFCAQFGVPHRRYGKLIVATSEPQLAELQKIRAAALGNAVALELLSGDEARALEPQLACVGALHSPLTGIIDSHEYMLTLLGQAEAHGAALVLRSRVTRIRRERDGFLIDIAGEPEALSARRVINSAGLDAPLLARAIEGLSAQHVPTPYLAKGCYFGLTGRSPFQRLVYPVPEPGGLGVHLTLDLAGRARFGPDVEWVSNRDYDVAPHRADRFYAAIRAYWPALADGALHPAYAGLRPKISGPQEAAADFRIDGPARHGIAGLVNLFGIESPGLTASLAIARHVADLAQAAPHARM